jgi:phenylacetate-CoA ligase
MASRSAIETGGMADETPGAVRDDGAGATSEALMRMRSDVSGLEWPPIVTGPGAVLAAFVHQLEKSQWMSAATLGERQRQQLALLARHASRHSKHFRGRLRDAGVKPEDLAAPGGLARLPVLTRREAQRAGEAFYCAEVPPDHLPLGETRTSGATGEPVVTRRTEATHLIWLAMSMRDHLWHRRDFSARMAACRGAVKKPAQLADWGAPASLLYRTGPTLDLPNTMDARALAEALTAFRPNILLIYPGSLAALTDHCRAAGTRLRDLRHIRTVGETLTPRVRGDAEDFFGASIEDAYSSQELGYIALQCPTSGLYHAMAESHIVEVLDERGEACREGEIGRVVVTDLDNFATPLVRYDIGDLAEVGGPCPCGRGLYPTLRRIVGRERNLILMPDGSRHWPHVGYKRFRDIAPISQYQFIQVARETIEVRLVTERPIAAEEEDALRAIMRASLGFTFELPFTYWQGRLPPDASGKFEEFVCRIVAHRD